MKSSDLARLLLAASHFANRNKEAEHVHGVHLWTSKQCLFASATNGSAQFKGYVICPDAPSDPRPLGLLPLPTIKPVLATVKDIASVTLSLQASYLVTNDHPWPVIPQAALELPDPPLTPAATAVLDTKTWDLVVKSAKHFGSPTLETHLGNPTRIYLNATEGGEATILVTTVTQ